MTVKAKAPSPMIDHSATIAELRAARARIARRLTAEGYSLPDRLIDAQAAAKRGISDNKMRIIRASTEVEALDAAIAAMEGRL